MGSLRFLTAGESHGRGLIGIIEGIPAGLALTSDDIDKDLRRRQTGYGRSSRMKIEQDHADILSGVRWGSTIGSPITFLIQNMDWKNWQQGMSPENGFEGAIPAVTRPRPGHADLAGAIKYSQRDIRNILERSSARETAMRVALGAVARKFLNEFGIVIGSYVTMIGTAGVPDVRHHALNDASSLYKLFSMADKSLVRCPHQQTGKRMVQLINTAADRGDSLGGIFEVIALGVPIGLGSYIQWDKRLNGRLAQAVMSIQAIKGVEIGSGVSMARCFGSEIMDEIFRKKQGAENKTQTGMGNFHRGSNHAGGIEGGVTNGLPIIVRAAMKPIPTLKKPLHSVDIITRKPVEAAYERSDTCAVPAASVIGEAMVALVLADAMLEKFGGDHMNETKKNFTSYIKHVLSF